MMVRGKCERCGLQGRLHLLEVDAPGVSVRYWFCDSCFELGTRLAEMLGGVVLPDEEVTPDLLPGGGQ
jgi:hypothetical protein